MCCGADSEVRAFWRLCRATLAVDASDASTDAGDNAAAGDNVADAADVADDAADVADDAADAADAACVTDAADAANAADAACVTYSADIADATDATHVALREVANARDVADVSYAFSYGADGTDGVGYVTNVSDAHAIWREGT